MKKLVFLFATVLLSAGILSAQSFTKDTKILDLGVGVGGSYVVGKSTIPPVSVSFEKGITDKISIGGLAGYSGSNNDLGFGFKYTYTNILLGVRGAYHLYTTDKIDAYGGAMLGYNIVSAKASGTSLPGVANASASGVAYSGFVGGRYLFTEKLGAFAELGFGLSLLRVGVTLNL